MTDAAGDFHFDGVEAGTYDLQFMLGGRFASESGVVVEPEGVAEVSKEVDWTDVALVETVVVTSGARKRERIVDAPAAITTLTPEEIELGAPNSQVPDLLEFTPAAQIAQSGLYDYNLNTRGFNNFLTRRVQTLVDGREIAIPFLSSQEWAMTTALMDDLESVEFLRGPSAALYGPNTFNGVLNLTTKAPRESLGGIFRLTGGELGSLHTNFRWASELGNDWYFKAVAGHSESDGFRVSRNTSTEYPGLPPEAVPLPDGKVRADSVKVRFDKYFKDDKLVTLEGGIDDMDNELFVSAAGRSFVPESDRSYLRFNMNAPRWNVLAYYGEREAPDGVSMASGGLFSISSDTYLVELQGNLPFTHGRLVGGVSYGEEKADSADSAGMQTILADAVKSNRRAVFGQLDLDLGDRVDAMFAVRWDDSTLYDSQISPKVAFVFSVNDNNKIRLSYNEAFQRPNYGELFIKFPAGFLDLSALEAGLAPLLGGVSLGFGSVPIEVLGNGDLDVEKIRSYEIGYSAILGRRAYLNINYYRNHMKDFISETLPGVNPNIPPYMAPSSLPDDVRTIVEDTVNGAVPGMSNDASGGPLFTLSQANVGQVDAQGAEIALSVMVGSKWLAEINYAWFDFNKDPAAGITTANTPENTASAGFEYLGERFRLGLHYRWSDSFDWRSGVHVGPVPSYDVADLDALFKINERFQVGANIDNLLNNVHYEVFGGDLLERRALIYGAVTW